MLSQEKNSNVDVQSSRSQEFRTSIRLQLAGATNFEIAPGPPPYKIAVFVPERYGSQASPGRVNVYHFPNFDRPVASKLFFKAQEVRDFSFHSRVVFLSLYVHSLSTFCSVRC